MTRRLAALATLAVVAAALAVGVTVVQHEAARAAWDAVSARVDEADYAPEESDRLYREVDVLRTRSRSLGWALAATLMLAGWSIGGATRKDAARTQASRPLLLRASGLDAATVVLGVAVSLGARGMRLGSPAASDLVGMLVPAVVLAGLVALAARGHTPGTGIAGLEVGWPAVRAPLVVLAMPLAVLAVLSTRSSAIGRAAPHLAVAGVL